MVTRDSECSSFRPRPSTPRPNIPPLLMFQPNISPIVPPVTLQFSSPKPLLPAAQFVNFSPFLPSHTPFSFMVSLGWRPITREYIFENQAHVSGREETTNQVLIYWKTVELHYLKLNQQFQPLLGRTIWALDSFGR